MRGLHTDSLTAKTQANGAQTISVEGFESLRHYQIQAAVSATPSDGTLAVAIRTPGASEYTTLGTIDLVNGPLTVQFEAFCDSIQLTPTSFDAEKTYSIFLVSGEVR